VTSGPPDGSFDSDPAWSPDGRAIAYTHATYDTISIAVVGLDGTPPVTLAQGGSGPAWSPDGTQIAFGDERGVEVVSPTGGPVRLLVAKPRDGPVGDVAYSPDGKLIAFAEGPLLYVAPADGSMPASLLTDGAEPSFSPDGQHVVYIERSSIPGVRGAANPQRDLYVVGVDGRGTREVRTTIYDETGPTWRPGA
jgi:Tol biopolymer transport system component